MPKDQAGTTLASTSSDQLLAFIQYLRGNKIPVSPADTLDAVGVAELVGYDDRVLLRDGLASALAKSRHELTLFEAAFEDYFQLSSEQSRPAGNKASEQRESHLLAESRWHPCA